jgi:heme A synthase
MSLADAEIPDSQLERDRQTGQEESLGPVTPLNRRVYLAVIAILGFVLIIGVLGWLLLAADGKSMPDGLGVILGTVAGALVALISSNSKD